MSTYDDQTEALPRGAGGENGPAEPGEAAPETRRRGWRPVSRRTRLTTAAVAAVLAATAGGIALTWAGAGSGGPQDKGPAAGQSTEVKRTSLSRHKSMPGTLGFSAPVTVKGRGAGTVTWLPKTGATLDRGGQLARVDDRPVTVFRGSMPLYRALGAPQQPDAPDKHGGGSPGGQTPVPQSAGGSANTGTSGTTLPDRTAGGNSGTGAAGPGARGTDVKILEENLYALGYHDFGRPDNTLTNATIAAVKRWQKSLGMQPTGQVAPGDVVVLPGTVRVGDIKAHLGDTATQDLMEVTGTDRVVSVAVAVSDLSLVSKGSKVTVTLPGGKSANGRVAGTGTVATGGPGAGKGGQDQESSGSGDARGGSGGEEAKVRVTVALDDPSAAVGLDGAQVAVDFTSENRDGVLAVPVSALVALREGGYALQLPAPAGTKPKLVPVTTGMFAKGLVEVSGPGIKEGMKVVSTA